MPPNGRWCERETVIDALDDGELDSAALVRDVEHTFCVRFDDADLEACQTVDDLWRLVCSDRPRDGDAPCPTAQAHTRLRRACVDRLGVDRAAAAPGAAIATLLPRRGRRAQWAALGRELGVHLPALRRPRLVRWAVAVTSVVAALCAGAAVFTTGVILAIAAAAVFAGGATAALMTPLTTRLAVVPPRGCVRLGDLARIVSRRGAIRCENGNQATAAAPAFEKLVALIAAHYGIAPGRIGRRTRFVAASNSARV